MSNENKYRSWGVKSARIQSLTQQLRENKCVMQDHQTTIRATFMVHKNLFDIQTKRSGSIYLAPSTNHTQQGPNGHINIKHDCMKQYQQNIYIKLFLQTRHILACSHGQGGQYWSCDDCDDWGVNDDDMSCYMMS